MTPARASASISAVRPKASGSWIGETLSAGCASAAMVPERLICVPSGEAVTWMSVGPPAASVWTVEVTW